MKVFKNGVNLFNFIMAIIPFIAFGLSLFNFDFLKFLSNKIDIEFQFLLYAIYFSILGFSNYFYEKYKETHPDIIIENIAFVKTEELNKGERFLSFSLYLLNKTERDINILSYKFDTMKRVFEFDKEHEKKTVKANNSYVEYFEKIDANNVRRVLLTIEFSNNFAIKKYINLS
ncbi:MAG TPA: hypothetical protein PK771_05105 [Spirochaetota bacterium]|nr:hypothetical protein [Spirochaetota bacterium]